MRETEVRLTTDERRQIAEEIDHAPWHYTEYGVLCSCGNPMDSDETCRAGDLHSGPPPRSSLALRIVRGGRGDEGTTWAAPGTSQPGAFDPQLWTTAALTPAPAPDDAEGKG